MGKITETEYNSNKSIGAIAEVIASLPEEKQKSILEAILQEQYRNAIAINTEVDKRYKTHQEIADEIIATNNNIIVSKNNIKSNNQKDISMYNVYCEAHAINNEVNNRYKTYQQLADFVALNIDKILTDEYNINLRSNIARLNNYTYVSNFASNGIAVAIDHNGKYKYINKDGVVQNIEGINADIKYISEFKDDKAYVVVNNNGENESFYIVYDTKSKNFKRISGSYIRAESFSEGIARVYKEFVYGDDRIIKKWIFIDNHCKPINLKNLKYQNLQSFSDGYGAIQLLNGKWRFINKNMELVGDEYIDIKPFCNDMAAVKGIDGKWYLIDNSFKRISGDESYNDVKYSKYTDIYAVKLDNNKWVFMDKTTNKQKFDICVDDVGVFSKEGITCVREDNKYYFINVNGVKLFNQHYNKAYDFKDGVAKVQKNNEYFYINTDGDRVF